jgi:copper chaperone CopZ
MNHHHGQSRGDMTAVTMDRFSVKDLYCACCANELEQVLKANPHIDAAKVDFLNNSVEVAYHPSMISAQEAEQLPATFW